MYLRKSGHIFRRVTRCEWAHGVEISTGSLGQGLAAGSGMALAAKLDGRESRIYVLMGDGEMQEGMIWEAAMAAAHYRLDNLVGILDYNGLQIDGPVDEIMSLEPLADKWRAFGWDVISVDGHDFDEINGALDAAKGQGQTHFHNGKNSEGQGVSFMENQVDWHGKAPK